MKKLLFFLFLLSASLSLHAQQRSTICLNMIVKNEAHVICRCLDSVLPLIDSYLIVDTGSTDGTQDIIRNYMANKRIPGTVEERPWINFAYNRNEALKLGVATGADYLLFMDADDILTYQPGYVRPDYLDRDGYYTHIHYSGTHYDRIQLISTKLNWNWIGVVHEVVYCAEATNCAYLDGVTMTIIGGGGRSQDPNKFLKDVQMLEDDLLIDPNNSRTLFYLAQSYRDAELLEKAINVYEQRVALGGWDEEVFWSLYQIANIQERLGIPTDIIQASYYKAFNYRPSRIEPLYRIASLHRRTNYPYHGLLIANMAMKVPQPNDLIFVESWIYEFGLPFEYSICAYLLGLYQDAFNVSLKLLSNPQTPPDVRKAVEHNLQAIIQGMSQSQPPARVA